MPDWLIAGVLVAVPVTIRFLATFGHYLLHEYRARRARKTERAILDE
jgi:hypothetical protein